MAAPRPMRAGESIENHCRAFKTNLLHTVIVVDPDGRPLRVSCDYCEGQHNFRGGGRIDTAASFQPANPQPANSQPANVHSVPSPVEKPRLPDPDIGISMSELEQLL